MKHGVMVDSLSGKNKKKMKRLTTKKDRVKANKFIRERRAK